MSRSVLFFCPTLRCEQKKSTNVRHEGKRVLVWRHVLAHNRRKEKLAKAEKAGWSGDVSDFLVFLECFCPLFSFFFLFFLFFLVVLVWAVRQTVPSQVTVAPKHLSAAATAVGLDVCMGEKVSFQVTSLIKGSSACGAFVGRFLFRFKASKGLFPFIMLHYKLDLF